MESAFRIVKARQNREYPLVSQAMRAICHGFEGRGLCHSDDKSLYHILYHATQALTGAPENQRIQQL